MILLSVALFFVWTFFVPSNCAICPKNCNCGSPIIWRCTSTQLRPSVECGQLQLGDNSNNIKVHLTLETGPEFSPLFNGVERCRVIMLRVQSDWLMSNRQLVNLRWLTRLRLQHSLGSSSSSSSNPSRSKDLLAGLDRLQTLKIENHPVPEWRRSILSFCPRLRDLKLISLRIEAIEASAFSRCSQLSSLDVRSNLLSRLEVGSFSGLSRLVSLDLSFNKISAISTASADWSELPLLQTLDLSNNELFQIEAGSFSGLRRLQQLFLGRNQLRSLSEQAFSGLPMLEVLHIDENARLITISVKVLTPVARSLTELRLGLLQCLEDRGGLYMLPGALQKQLATVAACSSLDIGGLKPARPWVASTAADAAAIDAVAAQFKSILVAVLITLVVFSISIFLVIYCCVVRKLHRNSKRPELGLDDNFSRSLCTHHSTEGDSARLNRSGDQILPMDHFATTHRPAQSSYPLSLYPGNEPSRYSSMPAYMNTQS